MQILETLTSLEVCPLQWIQWYLGISSKEEFIIYPSPHCFSNIFIMAPKGKISVSFSTHNQHFWCVGFSKPHNSPVLTGCQLDGCPTIYNSDTNCLELAQTPQIKGSMPQGCPPSPPTSDTNCKSQVDTCTPTGYELGISTTPSSSSVIC